MVEGEADTGASVRNAAAASTHPRPSSRHVVGWLIDGSDLIITRKTTKSGDLASGTRSSYAHIGKEQQEKEMTQAIYEQIVDSVAARYLKDSSINAADVKALVTRLKREWSAISRTRPARKAAAKKVAAKKAAPKKAAKKAAAKK